MAKDRHSNELLVGDIVTRIGDDGKPVEGMVTWIGTSGADVNLKVGVGEGELNANSGEWEILKPEFPRQLSGPHTAAWRKLRAIDRAPQFDAQGRPIGSLVNAGAQGRVQYDAQGRPIVTGVQHDAYDAQGRPINTGVQYDAQGRPLNTGVQYDAQGRQINAGGSPQYDAQGRPIVGSTGAEEDQTLLNAGRITQAEFDARARNRAPTA